MQKVVYNLKFFESHPAWSEVQNICQNLRQNRFEAYLAGGCVRDLLMQNQPKDFDIATNATPDQIVALYPKALSVGREFGVIILAYEKFQIEIATFRKDGAYLDGRRPSQIEFSTPDEDAKRRDFTINALFLDVKTSTIIDYVEGIHDIKAKVIRAVGDPHLRFAEDKLRMLRAVRFSSQLEFTIESETLRAITKEHESLGVVSSERIHDELKKWLQTENLRPCLDGLWSTGLIKSLHPTFLKLFDQKAFDRESQFFAQDLSALSLSSKFALFFSFIVSKNQTDEFDRLKKTLKDLKFSAEQTNVLLWIFTNYFKFYAFQNLRLSDQVEILAHAYYQDFEAYLKIANADLFTKLKSWIENLKGEYLPLPEALIDGDTLKDLGHKPGREMGELLKEIYRLQIEKKISSKSDALEYIKHARFS